MVDTNPKHIIYYTLVVRQLPANLVPWAPWRLSGQWPKDTEPGYVASGGVATFAVKGHLPKQAMASCLIAMAYNLDAMASNLEAMASYASLEYTANLRKVTSASEKSLEPHH